MRIVANPTRVPTEAVEPSAEVRAFHRRLPGYAPTPLRAVPALAAPLGLASLHVKDESERLGLPAFKILGASWAAYRVLVDRLGVEPRWDDLADLRRATASLAPLELVTATDGNHGRAVARAAAWFGVDAHVLVPAGTAAARIDGIRSEGARVTVVDGTYDDAVAEAAALAGERAVVVSDTSWDGYTTIPAWVIEGYGTIFAEVTEQRGGLPIDLVVVQVGVGALAAAAVHHLGASAEVVAVEPVDAACALAAAEAGGPVTVPGPHRSIMAGLNCGTVSPIAWPTLAAGVDVFVAIDDAPVEQAMRDLAAIGTVAGETGASGLAGLRGLAASGTHDVAGRHVLVLNTEGATDPEGYARIVGTVGHPNGYLP